MECIKCGYKKAGIDPDFICEDCQNFSEIVDRLWEDVNYIFNNIDTINPNTDPVLQLLSDSSFVTHDNPQTRIFYKLSSLIVDKAWSGIDEIDEIELNKSISTTKTWHDILIVFEELDIIEVISTKYQRILKIKDKPKKVALALKIKDSLDEEMKDRTVLIFSGYVFMYLLYKTSQMEKKEDIYEFPYKRRPKTLWVTLMAIWSKAYFGGKDITEEELTKLLGKRGIVGSTNLKIRQSLQHLTKDSTGLVRQVTDDKGYKVYSYSDYVTMELERIRTGRSRYRAE